MKFFALSMVVGIGSSIGGYSFGSVADELITYFDEYSDDKYKQEAKDKKTGEEDAFGTAAGWDLLYPYGVIVMAELLYTVIVVGGFLFGFTNANFDYPLECDTFDKMDKATRQQLQMMLNLVHDLPSCYNAMPIVFLIADLNQDGVLDKCENANLLY